MSSKEYFDIFSKYNDFRDVVIYQYRSVHSHPFLRCLDEYIEVNRVSLHQNKTLYRARLFDEKRMSEYISVINKFGGVVSSGENGGNIVPNPYSLTVFEANKTLNRNKGYYGFSKADCMMPPKGAECEGRLNPKYIRMFYVAEEPDTAAKEVLPQRGQQISLCKLTVKKEMFIADLAINVKSMDQKNGKELQLLFIRLFSSTHSDDKDNLIAQAIVQHVKGHRYKAGAISGIRYGSARNDSGHNIVLFSEKNIAPISSELFWVEDVNLVTRCVGLPDEESMLSAKSIYYSR